MAKIIKPPHPLYLHPNDKSVFLAGSIEMGRATNWQAAFEQAFQQIEVVLLNPRREKWDSTWVQSIENKQFREQGEWELEAQERADVIAMYFSPATKSPIALLELGLFARSGKLIVCCPDGYWRKGNVDIVCKRYGVQTVSSFGGLIETVKRKLMSF